MSRRRNHKDTYKDFWANQLLGSSKNSETPFQKKHCKHGSLGRKWHWFVGPYTLLKTFVFVALRKDIRGDLHRQVYPMQTSSTPQTGSCLLGDHALTLPYSIPQKRRDQPINLREREDHFEKERWIFLDLILVIIVLDATFRSVKTW